jgi:hypothetical protein
MGSGEFSRETLMIFGEQCWRARNNCRYGFGTYDDQSTFLRMTWKKGSQFLHGYLKSTLKNTLNLDSSFERTESSVKLEIDL